MKKEDGGPAFPIGPVKGFSRWRASEGLSLRDYFAAKAMQAIIGVTWHNEHTGEAHVAAWAYQQADAMLEERKK